MGLYYQIKELYPDILSSEFMLQDDSNGKGAYIKWWKSAYPKPTQAELDSVGLKAAKKEKLGAKSIASQVVYLKAPAFKQNNVSMGIYDVTTSAPIIKWVKAVRQAVDEIEIRINNAITIVEIDAITFNFDNLKARAEAIFLTL